MFENYKYAVYVPETWKKPSYFDSCSPQHLEFSEFGWEYDIYTGDAASCFWVVSTFTELKLVVGFACSAGDLDVTISQFWKGCRLDELCFVMLRHWCHMNLQIDSGRCQMQDAKNLNVISAWRDRVSATLFVTTTEFWARRVKWSPLCFLCSSLEVLIWCIFVFMEIV